MEHKVDVEMTLDHPDHGYHSEIIIKVTIQTLQEHLSISPQTVQTSQVIIALLCVCVQKSLAINGDRKAFQDSDDKVVLDRLRIDGLP